MADHADLDARLFALDPDEFIDTCAQRLGLTEQDFPDAERAFLRAALFAGKPRLAVLDAILRQAGPYDGRRDLHSPLNAATLDHGHFLLSDLLLRFAPEDDEAFLAHLFPLIVGRQPEEFERLPLTLDLRHKRIDRQGVIDRLVRTAHGEGRKVQYVPSRGTAKAQVDFPDEVGLDAKGRPTFSLCHRLPAGGWRMMPQFLRQPPDVEDDVWHLRPGFVLAGPKVDLAPGLWRIALDIVQSEDARVVLDVVANNALDLLLHVEIAGSFDGALTITVRSHHHFVEARLFKPEQDEGLMWLRMGRVQFTRIRDLPDTL